MTSDPHTVATQWLSALTSAVENADVEAITQQFLPDGWLRDLLVFTWDVRSLAGRSKISSYLSNSLSGARLIDIRLDDTTDLSPRTIVIPLLQGAAGVELAFTFECRHGHGRAHARLLPDDDGTFRALSLLTEVADLVGHEESSVLSLRDDLTGIPGRSMQHEFENWVKDVETKPYVLIGTCAPTSLHCTHVFNVCCDYPVGAGQTGLQIAARFKQMNIPTLVMDRQSRIGDVWRKRYPSLTLHTVRRHHTCM